jgi:hypothetical protein
MGFTFPNVDINQFSAGFIGFRNHVDAKRLGKVVSRIKASRPDLFAHWEIEQAIWSVLFNCFERPINLDDVVKDYVGSSYWDYSRMKEAVLVHFVGSRRFKNLSYLRLARKVVHELVATRSPTAAPYPALSAPLSRLGEDIVSVPPVTDQRKYCHESPEAINRADGS